MRAAGDGIRRMYSIKIFKLGLYWESWRYHGQECWTLV